MMALTRLLNDAKCIVGKGSSPPVSCGIKLCRGQNIGKWVVVHIHLELKTIQIFMKYVGYGPF